MRKYLLSFLPFLMMAMCVCVLSSCSDDDDDGVSPIVGTWVETYKLSESTTLVTTFTFNSNGSGEQTTRYVMDGEGITSDPATFRYTYTASTGVITLQFDESGAFYKGEASLTGKVLALSLNNGNINYTLTKQ